MNAEDRGRIFLFFLILFALVLGPLAVVVTAWGVYSGWPGLNSEWKSVVLVNTAAVVGTTFCFIYARNEFGWFGRKKRD